MTDFARARENMVNGQLMTNGIHDKALLETYRAVPREAFVDPSFAARVYVDEDTRAAANGNFVIDPLVEARLVQEALSGPVATALVLGASGLPSAVVLAAHAATVLVLEPDAGQAAAARKRLEGQSIANVTVIEADYRTGYVAQAPYDAILIPGAVHEVPAALLDQLNPGGRLLCVAREESYMPGRAVCLQRLENGHVLTKIIADVSTPYLPGFEPGAEFSF